MSSYPEETARTWSHQPPPSYHAPGVSFCPTQTQQTTGMRACQSAPEYGGNFNWPENGNETQFGAQSETLPTTVPYPQYQHTATAFSIHPYGDATTSSPPMMPPGTSQYEQQSHLHDYKAQNHRASLEASWVNHAGPHSGFSSYGSTQTTADSLPGISQRLSEPPWSDRHQRPYYSDKSSIHPAKDMHQPYLASTDSSHAVYQTAYVDAQQHGEDNLQALDFHDTLPNTIVQRRIQAMAATMEADDVLESTQLIVVSHFFRDAQDEVYLANVKDKTDWEAVKDDTMFVDMALDGKIATFEELETRKRELLSSMAFDDVDKDLQGFHGLEDGCFEQSTGHRGLSVEQEERLAALGVTGVPKSVQPYDSRNTQGALDQPSVELQPASTIHQAPAYPTEPRQGASTSHHLGIADNDTTYQNNHNQGPKNKKNKNKKKQKNQQHKQQGRTQSHHRARSPTTSSNQYYDSRHDHPKPPSSGRARQMNNQQGRKRAYEEPRQYVRGGDGGTPGKRRKWI